MIAWSGLFTRFWGLRGAMNIYIAALETATEVVGLIFDQRKNHEISCDEWLRLIIELNFS